ncbi:phage major capsid protein [Streptomyces chumphonensis]|uniref:Phage major capsid protein n=1 Tax=Streptomyces chumphonensis TaxID=1214925 RepID=A0A927EYE0_9ACTN|nr:phage major capsid protein [Streptomyces chumphonensis]MBD3931931.1 phage major capsid protein [Streptomyces chumphonensis]
MPKKHEHDEEPAFERAKDLKAATERVGQIHEEMGVIDTEAGGEDLDETAQRSWDDLEAELKFREGEVRAFERAERLRASRERWSSTQFSPQNDPFADDPRTLSGRAVYDRSMAVVDSSMGGRHLRDDQKSQVQHVLRTQTGDTNGELVGRLLLATENPSYRSAFQKIAATQTPIFTPEESRAIEQVQLLKRAMSIGVDASGGFAVPVLIDPTIILTAQGSENDILRLARVETITNDTWRGLSSAGVSWSFKAEAAAAADNSPTIAQPEVPTRRADGFIPFSIEIGMDWPGFAEQMSMLLAEGYDELLADKLTTGTSGSNEPNGLVSSLDALTSPANIELTTAGVVGAVDIYGLWNELPQKYRRKATTAWLSSTDVQNTIRQLGTTDPNFTVDITQEAIPRLFGREYPMNDFMEDSPSGTGTQPLLAVGDFKGYLVAQRAGMTVEFIPQLFDVTNNRPTGQRGWFAWARVGAGVVDANAFRLLVNRSA